MRWNWAYLFEGIPTSVILSYLSLTSDNIFMIPHYLPVIFYKEVYFVSIKNLKSSLLTVLSLKRWRKILLGTLYWLLYQNALNQYYEKSLQIFSSIAYEKSSVLSHSLPSYIKNESSSTKKVLVCKNTLY